MSVLASERAAAGVGHGGGGLGWIEGYGATLESRREGEVSRQSSDRSDEAS
jgi:hypothetical protein